MAFLSSLNVFPPICLLPLNYGMNKSVYKFITTCRAPKRPTFPGPAWNWSCEWWTTWPWLGCPTLARLPCWWLGGNVKMTSRKQLGCFVAGRSLFMWFGVETIFYYVHLSVCCALLYLYGRCFCMHCSETCLLQASLVFPWTWADKPNLMLFWWMEQRQSSEETPSTCHGEMFQFTLR